MAVSDSLKLQSRLSLRHWMEGHTGCCRQRTGDGKTFKHQRQAYFSVIGMDQVSATYIYYMYVVALGFDGNGRHWAGAVARYGPETSQGMGRILRQKLNDMGLRVHEVLFATGSYGVTRNPFPVVTTSASSYDSQLSVCRILEHNVLGTRVLQRYASLNYKNWTARLHLCSETETQTKCSQ